jgi:hypothetical protein
MEILERNTFKLVFENKRLKSLYVRFEFNHTYNTLKNLWSSTSKELSNELKSKLEHERFALASQFRGESVFRRISFVKKTSQN